MLKVPTDCLVTHPKELAKLHCVANSNPPRGGGGVLPIMAYTGWLQVYERVGILLVEVYERVGKSVIWVCERAQRG